MALSDKVSTNRYGLQRLIEYTNPGAPAAVAIDADRLAASCADAEGDFLRFVGVAYDDANAVHVGPAVRRAFACLAQYMDPVGAFAADLIAKSETELLSLRDRVGAGQRLPVTTDSGYTPSTIDTAHGAVRPDMDSERFRDLLLNPNPTTDE